MCSHNQTSINSMIQTHSGRLGLQLCKLWERDMVKISKFKEHLTFNYKCFQNNIIPKTLQVKSKDNIKASHEAARICSLAFLKNRIFQSKQKLKYLYKSTSKNFDKMTNLLPPQLINLVKDRTHKKCEYFKLKYRNRQKTKFNKLISTCSSRASPTKRNISGNFPDKHNNLSDTWVINLTDIVFDKIDLSVLKLDPKFQIVPRHINREQIIANIESKLSYIVQDKSKLEKIRLSLINSLNTRINIKPNLTQLQIKSIQKLKKCNDIIITNSDKGKKL